MSSAANYKAECSNSWTFKCVVLLRNGAGFTSLKGNSTQSCHFTKKHKETAPFVSNGQWRPSMVLTFFLIVVTLFFLLSWSQNKACVTLDRYFMLALNNVAVWSSHAVINFIGNHFESHHVLSSFYFFKKSLKTGIWVGFLVPNAWYLQGKYIHKQFGSILTFTS